MLEMRDHLLLFALPSVTKNDQLQHQQCDQSSVTDDLELLEKKGIQQQCHRSHQDLVKNRLARRAMDADEVLTRLRGLRKDRSLIVLSL